MLTHVLSHLEMMLSWPKLIDLSSLYFQNTHLTCYSEWSDKWQMLLNFEKCKCLHAGHGNTGVNYEMGGTIICKTVKENDLGVTINANRKVSEQCRFAVLRVTRFLE